MAVLMTDEQIISWLKNKKIPAKRKIFLILGINESIGLTYLSYLIRYNRVYVSQILSHMKIDGYVQKSGKPKSRSEWYLTERGIKQLKRCLKYGSIPTRKMRAD